MKQKQVKAILLALSAALFYAISIPLSKLILKQASPTMVAAFCYLGAGLGIGFIYLFKRKKESSKEKLSKKDLPYTLAMILLDVLAAILLMNGVALTTAANASLLNNFEIVATSSIAFMIFKEKCSWRMVVAIVLITLSSFVLSFEGSASLSFSTGSLMVLGAAICWGAENNCTRMISSKSTYEIVMIKGLCSGTCSLIIALIIGESWPSLSLIAMILALGFISYGLSIFTYIKAQAIIGAAKTSAFYALAPFIGALFSFVVLGESLSSSYALGSLIMIAGSSLAIIDTLKYQHAHMHTHTIYHLHHGVMEKEVITHTHEHTRISVQCVLTIIRIIRSLHSV